MISGLYTATMGMVPLMDKQDQIANNLANINTTGFKQSGLFIKSYQKYLQNDQHEPFANSEIKADQVYIDYSEGPMKQTDAPFDLMLKGTGFFTIMTPNGLEYTRNGNFSIDSEGLLVTSDGSKVLGKDGYIKIEEQYPVTITEEGEIVQQGQIKNVIKVVDFEKPYRLLRCGESRFKPALPDNPERKSAGYAIRQGYLEGSNVSFIRNMVSMISTYRNFEADQRALLAQDQTLDKAVNQVGRIS